MSTVVTAANAPRVSAPFVGAFELRVIEGPDAGKSMLIDDASPPRLYVGRSASCALTLEDPRVSRRHLAIELQDDAENAMGRRVRRAHVDDELLAEEVL